MSGPFAAFYLRMMASAVVFVVLVSSAVYALTRDAALVGKYCAAHAVAIVLGAAVDFLIVTYFLPRGGLAPTYMNAIFIAPIAFFIGFSIYICHRDTIMHAHDVLLPIAPIVTWGCLVVWGGQRGMGDFDVLGAWFVSAGCGGVDLAAHFGPRPLTRRPLAAKLAGYLVMLLGVYWILPRATR